MLSWIKRILFFILLVIFCWIGWAIYKKYNNYKNVQELEQLKQQLGELEQKENENWKEEIIKMTGLDKFSEFKENPNLLEKWLKKFGTYWQVKYWLDIGINPNEYDFACWIYNIKSKQFSDFQTKINYQEPIWVKENINIEELRREYGESKNN